MLPDSLIFKNVISDIVAWTNFGHTTSLVNAAAHAALSAKELPFLLQAENYLGCQRTITLKKMSFWPYQPGRKSAISK